MAAVNMLHFLSRRHFKLQNSLREHDRLIPSTAIFLLNVVVCISSEPADKPISHLGFFCQMCILEVSLPAQISVAAKLAAVPAVHFHGVNYFVESFVLDEAMCSQFLLQAKGYLCMTSF